jgi:hypothetical protein
MRSLLGIAALLDLLITPAFSQDTSTSPTEPAQATPAQAITLELNKLETRDGACTIYMVVNNQGSEALKELKLDVYLFDKQEVILQGLLFQFDNIGAERQSVVPFKLPEVGCDEIGRMLLNKVLVCNDSGGAPIEGCGDRLQLNSKSEVAFES